MEIQGSGAGLCWRSVRTGISAWRKRLIIKNDLNPGHNAGVFYRLFDMAKKKNEGSIRLLLVVVAFRLIPVSGAEEITAIN